VAECESGHFQCRHTSVCIASHLVCDGRYQCGGDDTSDELGCTNSENTIMSFIDVFVSKLDIGIVDMDKARHNMVLHPASSDMQHSDIF